jgi:protein-S-isoprenylcysteine O-methyltransferase Ste14
MEARLSQRHLQGLAQGTISERCPRLAKLFYRFPFLFAPLAFWEFMQSSEGQGMAETWVASVPAKLPLIAMGLLIGGYALRMFAIRSLGTLWTNRCLAVAGMERIVSGPYKYLRHPEYVGRIMEGLGLCLFLGSYVTAFFYVVTASIVAFQLATHENQLLSMRVLRQPS